MVISRMNEAVIALTVAGSDSGGGAGIQADLKTFLENGVYGTSAITCLTAQNPSGVTGIFPISPDFTALQIRAVIDFFPVKSVKTGMLFSEEIILRISEELKPLQGKIIVDPVMVATSGALLLEKKALRSMTEKLFPLAGLLTPNLAEASVLLEPVSVHTDNLPESAERLYEKFGIPVLLKGGHSNSNTAIDIFYSNEGIREFASPMILGVNTHGTGCTLSSAICANFAKGFSLVDSISKGKDYINQTLTQAVTIHEEKFLNHGSS